MKIGLMRLLVLALCIFIPITSSGEDNDLKSRIASGILKWKTSDQTRPWWYCGVKLEGQDAIDKSYEWANIVVDEVDKIKSELGYDLNVWGVLGTMSRESAFDECALGLYPRLWAYEHNLLKKRKRHITHTREEINKLVKNKEFMKRWPRLDLGPGQLMWRSVYKGKKEDLMSVDPGVGIVVREMANRLSHHIGFNKMISRLKGNIIKKHNKKWWYNRPWSFWPYGGGKPSKEYAKKVQRRAYLLGATKQELTPMKKSISRL